jgi:hypothetical protein
MPQIEIEVQLSIEDSQRDRVGQLQNRRDDDGRRQRPAQWCRKAPPRRPEDRQKGDQQQRLDLGPPIEHETQIVLVPRRHEKDTRHRRPEHEREGGADRRGTTTEHRAGILADHSAAASRP